jgi:hypothetical protein
LDALVAERVMGWTEVAAEHRSVASHWYVPSGVNPASRPNRGMRQQIPEYSTDIAAAWQVVEKIREHFDTVDFHVCTDGVRVLIGDAEAPAPAAWITVDPREGGAPLAICRAALAVHA